MFAKLSALVSGSNSLPFDLTDETGEATCGPWTLHSATLKADKSSISVFKFTFSPGHDARITNSARHGVKSLRTLRHPNILIFKDSIEQEEKGSTTLYLMTEPVRTLASILDDTDLSNDQKNAYLSMGLHQVACALSFLNNDCHQVHGKVGLSSVVVSQNLDWKLSCLDTLSEHTSLSSSLLRDALPLIGDVYKCPELMKDDFNALQEGPPWAIDSWGLGCLIREVFGNEALHSTASLRDTACIPPELLKDYQRLLSSICEKRLNPKRLLSNKYLNNELVEVVKFLESLAVKEVAEKNSFFKKLSQTLPELPLLVIHHKILPMVINALEFGSASPAALGCIMKIGADMDDEQFENTIAPALARFFSSSDRTIRRVLLENIDKFASRLPKGLINEKIYPNISNGFSDTNAYLRELTLKSMQHLSPKLDQKTLNQSLLKFLARLQVDTEPSIRANTTVLLGFIADHLGEASCKRILLNAFSRALKDQFPPARLAAIKALVVTKKYYSQEEVATRLIPSVAPLCVDPIADVKNCALSTLGTFVEFLKEESLLSVEDEKKNLVESSQKQKTTQNYVSWAVSSLGFVPNTETESKQTENPTPSSKEPTKQVSVPSSPQFESLETKREDSGDKWDFDDDAADDFFESGNSSPSETSRRSSHTATKEAAHKEEDKDEDDMWSEMGMKAPMPKKKPQSKGKGMKLGATKLAVD